VTSSRLRLHCPLSRYFVFNSLSSPLVSTAESIAIWPRSPLAIVLARTERPGSAVISILELERRRGASLVGDEDEGGVSFVVEVKEASVDIDVA
jgi:hypothetical protein